VAASVDIGPGLGQKKQATPEFVYKQRFGDVAQRSIVVNSPGSRLLRRNLVYKNFVWEALGRPVPSIDGECGRPRCGRPGHRTRPPPLRGVPGLISAGCPGPDP